MQNQTRDQPNGFVICFSGGSGGPSNCTTDATDPLTCSGRLRKAFVASTVWPVPDDGARDLPDVSLFAGDGTISGSFYVVCNRDFKGITGSCNLSNGNFLKVGGTSVSAQVFAGIMALVDQKNESKENRASSRSLYTLALASPETCNSAGPAGPPAFSMTLRLAQSQCLVLKERHSILTRGGDLHRNIVWI